MQSPYQLPHPLPPLPVRKGVRGRRPKSQTIAMLKAIQNSQSQNSNTETQLCEPRMQKKRGPKPGSKVHVLFYCRKYQLGGGVWRVNECMDDKRLHHSSSLLTLKQCIIVEGVAMPFKHEWGRCSDHYSPRHSTVAPLILFMLLLIPEET